MLHKSEGMETVFVQPPYPIGYVPRESKQLQSSPAISNTDPAPISSWGDYVIATGGIGDVYRGNIEATTSQESVEPVDKRAHNHYFKDVSKLKYIDVYRVLRLFGVTDPALQHAAKKLLVAGGRGAGKDINRDIQEAIDSLVRWQEMQQENV